MTTSLWKLSQSLEPFLWHRLASGELPEDVVELEIEAALERAERAQAPWREPIV